LANVLEKNIHLIIIKVMKDECFLCTPYHGK